MSFRSHWLLSSLSCVAGDPLSYLQPRLLPGALLYVHDSKDLDKEDNPKVLPKGHHVEGQSLYYQVALNISPNELKQKDAATKEEFGLSYASLHPKLASPDAKSSAFVSSPHSCGSCWKWHPQTSACSELKAEMAKEKKKKSQLYVFWLWGEETQQENCLKSSWQDHLESAFVGAASGLP